MILDLLRAVSWFGLGWAACMLRSRLRARRIVRNLMTEPAQYAAFRDGLRAVTDAMDTTRGRPDHE